MRKCFVVVAVGKGLCISILVSSQGKVYSWSDHGLQLLCLGLNGVFS